MAAPKQRSSPVVKENVSPFSVRNATPASASTVLNTVVTDGSVLVRTIENRGTKTMAVFSMKLVTEAGVVVRPYSSKTMTMKKAPPMRAPWSTVPFVACISLLWNMRARTEKAIRERSDKRVTGSNPVRATLLNKKEELLTISAVRSKSSAFLTDIKTSDTWPAPLCYMRAGRAAFHFLDNIVRFYIY